MNNKLIQELLAKAKMGKPMFEVGQKVKVGGFFWIREEDHIGFEAVAFHGPAHKDYTPGAVDIGRTVTIRGFEKVKGCDMAVVRLDRATTPFGHSAPTGQLFLIPISVMQKWLKFNDHQERRKLPHILTLGRNTKIEIWGRAGLSMMASEIALLRQRMPPHGCPWPFRGTWLFR